ncbi:hypothetical protein QBC44DRAFT_354467 [Cladorrhinum sp. PSN332]|nr:hypothetical protein QBC44DRAFT_354467 [Cladorrhinum sp. PSN332]
MPHQTGAGPTPSAPKRDAAVVSTSAAEAQEKLRLAEEAAARVREEIDRILTRGPISEQRIEELSAVARQFRRQAMDRRRRQQRKELAICVGVVVVGMLVWRFLK